MSTKWFVAGFVVLTCAAACGSGVGDACNEEGKIEGQCPSDAICGKTSGGALVCQQQCTDGAQCPSGEECNGISNTKIKGCRPK